MIISFSGLDAAGKSTQIALLRKKLIADGARVKVIWARGGYTPGFEFLKKCLRHFSKGGLPKSGHGEKREAIIGKPVIQKIWLIVAIVDLAIFWGIYLNFFRFLGVNVICDRYVEDTSLDFERNFPDVDIVRWWTWSILKIIVPKPSASFIFLIDPELSLERSKSKGEPFSDNLETLRWRHEKYTELIKENPSKYYIVNGDKHIIDIKTKIDACLFCDHID